MHAFTARKEESWTVMHTEKENSVVILINEYVVYKIVCVLAF